MKRSIAHVFLTAIFILAPSAADPVVVSATIFLTGEPAPAWSKLVTPAKENLVRTYSEEMRILRKTIDRTLPFKVQSETIRSYADSENKKLLLTLSSIAPGKRSSSATAVAIRIFEELKSNRIAKVEAVSNYDKRGDIGFCFGRAVFVHYRLLQEKFSSAEIAKIFALGRLRHQGQLWNFHMATMVKGSGGDWLVVDTLYDGVLKLPDWIEKSSRLSIRPDSSDVRFYVSEATKFQPAYGSYVVQDFEIPDLKSYFVHLFKDLR